ncbi:hypothetical protein D3C72_874610 [compost metagenome]
MRLQRHHLPIDTGAPAAVPQVGMQVIGEVHRRGAGGKLDHARLRRQHVDAFIRVRRRLDRIAVLAGSRPAGSGLAGVGFEGFGFASVGISGLLPRLAPAFDIAVPGQQLPHPRQLAVVFAGRRNLAALGARFLVAPMRRHAVFGELVHLARTDLHFERAAVIVRHHRMQRAVAVGLGPGNVIVELVGQRCPHLVHQPQRRVAGAHVVNDDAQRAQVIHLGKIQALDAHFVPDAVDMLGPAADFGIDAGLGQRRLQAVDGAGDEGLALNPFFFQQAGDLLVAVRLQEAERQVFHFPFDLPDAQAVCQRGIQVQRFAGEVGRARRLAFRVPAQGAQAGRQPHQHDAQVGRHGKQHLALHFLLRTGFGFGIAGLPGDHPQAQQGAGALHQPRDFGAERPRDRVVAQGRRGRHQVGGQGCQQRGGACGGVGMQGRQDADDAGAVACQGLAGQGVLPFKTRDSPGNGLINQGNASSVQTRANLLPPGSVERRRRVDNRRDGHHRRRAWVG